MQPWLLNGNAKTNPPKDFVGTIDEQPLLLKTAGKERLRISTNGDVGIATAQPDASLHLKGGHWDLTNTEGDFKIGDDQLRLKVGVALGGAGAGDSRIRAVGGTNRLMIGTGQDDTVTIANSQVSIGTAPGADGRLTVLGLPANAGGTLTSAGVVGQVTNLPFGGGIGNDTAGVRGINDVGHGVQGQSNSGPGVEGTSNSGLAVFGETQTGVGVWGTANRGTAGFFAGPVEVTGSLTKGGGGFRIDHPSDPERKYLNHSFVESSEMKNVYDGTVKMDAKGEAKVVLPKWVEELNEEFRYQLTAIGVPAPQLHVAEGIAHGSFRIGGGAPGQQICWQVTGVRKDRWAKANPITVEEEKDIERGYLLHPELFGRAKDRNVIAARFPKIVKK